VRRSGSCPSRGHARRSRWISSNWTRLTCSPTSRLLDRPSLPSSGPGRLRPMPPAHDPAAVAGIRLASDRGGGIRRVASQLIEQGCRQALGLDRNAGLICRSLPRRPACKRARRWAGPRRSQRTKRKRHRQASARYRNARLARARARRKAQRSLSEVPAGSAPRETAGRGPGPRLRSRPSTEPMTQATMLPPHRGHRTFGCARRRQSISAKKIVTPPVAKFGMSLTAACPSSDPKPA
jgi:hypothetical protein